MTFIPSINAAVRFAAVSCLGQIGAGILEYNDVITSDAVSRSWGVSNALSASAIALSILGTTPVGIASSIFFAAVAIGSLSGKLDEKMNNASYLASSIANLSGGVYSLIALPFSYLNAVSMVPLLTSVIIGGLMHVHD